MSRAKEGRELQVVRLKLGQHFIGRHEILVVVPQTLLSASSGLNTREISSAAWPPKSVATASRCIVVADSSFSS